MIWRHVVLAIGLVGFLSTVTESFTATGEVALTGRNASTGVENRFLFEIPMLVSEGFLYLLSSIAQALFSSKNRSQQGGKCVGKECSIRFDFSEDGQNLTRLGFAVASEDAKLSAPLLKADNTESSLRNTSVDVSSVESRSRIDARHPSEFVDYAKLRGTQSSDQNGPTPGLGVVLVKKKGEGPLCSGFLLMKPWIVVTTAQCVYGMAPADLFVSVALTEKVNGENMLVSVWVQNVYIAPGFLVGSDEHNLAVLIIYTQENWNLHEFIFGTRFFSNDDLSGSYSTALITYETEWVLTNNQEYHPRTYRGHATADVDLCDMTTDDFDYYCVKKQAPGNNFFGSINIGSPFFHWAGSVNHILGIYTGTGVGKRSRGHSYRCVWAHKNWIMGIVHHHNRPPVAK